MKLLSVIIKSLKEQLRSFWLLVLTILTAPFFVIVYYLITQSYEVKYDVLILNNDLGVQVDSTIMDHGRLLIEKTQSWGASTPTSSAAGCARGQ